MDSNDFGQFGSSETINTHWVTNLLICLILVIFQVKDGRNLSSDQKDHIGKFPLCIVEIENALDSEIQDLFLRLQEGVVPSILQKSGTLCLVKCAILWQDLGETH